MATSADDSPPWTWPCDWSIYFDDHYRTVKIRGCSSSENNLFPVAPLSVFTRAATAIIVIFRIVVFIVVICTTDCNASSKTLKKPVGKTVINSTDATQCFGRYKMKIDGTGQFWGIWVKLHNRISNQCGGNKNNCKDVCLLTCSLVLIHVRFNQATHIRWCVCNCTALCKWAPRMIRAGRLNRYSARYPSDDNRDLINQKGGSS